MKNDNDVCALCGSYSLTLFEAPNKKEYCANCSRIKYPPYMTLLKYADGDLYNLETGQYEIIDSPEDLELCGWEVKLIQKINKNTSLLYLEYSGDIECGRITDYTWYLGENYCLSSACAKHTKHLEPSKIAYPNWSSFYLTWKYGKTK